METLVDTCKRLLRVALVGAPNAGKSTLLNRLVNNEVSSVSNKVHTTRNNFLACHTEGDAQLEFLDSPGLITRAHMFKHKLEDSLLNDPRDATQRCDLIAAVIDVSNPREQKKLNKGVLDLLTDHLDKKSILIMNKVDLIKDKRLLLDIGARLSQDDIIPTKSLNELTNRSRHKYVIELDDRKQNQFENTQAERQEITGFKHFSRIFSISALEDDGVDDIRDYMLSQALPVDKWPHGPDYLTSQTTAQVVHSIIRGRVMDYLEQAVPYLLKYKYQHCGYDDMGSLHVELILKCPQRYMKSKVLVKISKIIDDSRELICKTLSCDVKLKISVENG